jgi:hypothetical protein
VRGRLPPPRQHHAPRLTPAAYARVRTCVQLSAARPVPVALDGGCALLATAATHVSVPCPAPTPTEGTRVELCVVHARWGSPQPPAAAGVVRAGARVYNGALGSAAGEGGGLLGSVVVGKGGGVVAG